MEGRWAATKQSTTSRTWSNKVCYESLLAVSGQIPGRPYTKNSKTGTSKLPPLTSQQNAKTSEVVTITRDSDTDFAVKACSLIKWHDLWHVVVWHILNAVKVWAIVSVVNSKCSVGDMWHRALKLRAIISRLKLVGCTNDTWPRGTWCRKIWACRRESKPGITVIMTRDRETHLTVKVWILISTAKLVVWLHWHVTSCPSDSNTWHPVLDHCL